MRAELAGHRASLPRHATSTIKIQPTLRQDLDPNSNEWNYMFAKDTGNVCDVTLSIKPGERVSRLP